MAKESGSLLTVVIAFCANLAIAIAKTVAAVITGSASMVAESAHSWADTGNQVLLFIADRRGSRPPDQQRPLGYGRESYVWAMFAALGLFLAGGVVSIYHGVVELGAESSDASFTIGYIVLAVAFCFEGVSFTQALRQTRAEASNLGRDVLGHALATSDPTLRAVLAEDSAALVGVVIAAIGLGLHQLTGEPAYDALGSIVVGMLLCAVGFVLIRRNHGFLAGELADTELHRAALERLNELQGVDRVTYLRLEFVGPRQLLLVARVDLVGEEPESDVARRLRSLEEELKQDDRILDAVLTLAVPEDESVASHAKDAVGAG